jgi:TRAP-type mannitol/chloroaromatic compound transport system substrate-binding protein
MLKDFTFFVDGLIKYTGAFQKARKADKEHFSKYFLSISECLSRLVEKIKIRETTNNELGQLIEHSESLKKEMGNVIGKDKAEELSKHLKNFSENESAKEDIKDIDYIAGRFKSLSDICLVSSGPRRKFLSAAAVATGLGGFAVGGGAGYLFREQQGTQSLNEFPKKSWTMQTFLGDEYKDTLLYNAPKQVSELIETMSGGRFKIEVVREKDGKSLKTDDIDDILEAVSVNNNKIQCGYSSPYYDTEKYKILYFGCAIPFGLTPQEQTAWLYHVKKGTEIDEKLELIPTYIQSLYRKEEGLNVIPFPAGATGSQMGGWFKKKVDLKDLHGKTMRIPGLGALVLKKMGMNIFPDSDNQAGIKNDITEAKRQLKNNEILAVEWTSPHDDVELGLNDAARYYYYPGWWEPSTTFDVHVNEDAWVDLPTPYKKIFELACREVYSSTLAEYDKQNSISLHKLKQDKNVELCQFSDAILDKAYKETQALLKRFDKNADFREAHKEWRDFKSKIRAWSNLTKMNSDR